MRHGIISLISIGYSWLASDADPDPALREARRERGEAMRYRIIRHEKGEEIETLERKLEEAEAEK